MHSYNIVIFIGDIFLLYMSFRRKLSNFTKSMQTKHIFKNEVIQRLAKSYH